MPPGIQKALPLPYDAVPARLPDALRSEVIAYEDGAGTVVVAVDPMETVAAKSDALRPIAEEVRSKLTRVLERLASGAA